MIKVGFVCDWEMSSDVLLNLYKGQTPNSSCTWDKIQGVPKVEDADVVILLGNAKFNGSDKTIIQFRREPDLVRKFVPHPNANFVYNYKDKGFHVSTWQFVSQNFDQLKDYPYGNKPKLVSGVTSAKWDHRNKFFTKIFNTETGVDIYGYEYKSLHPKFKDDALFPYKFSIAIENSSQENYFTEKINDCFLTWSIPIYWGCPNISEYFPEESYRLIDINQPETIVDILSEPITKENLEALTESRNLVMYKYNIWAVINDLLK